MDRQLGAFEQTLLYAILHLQDEEPPGASGPSIRKTIEAKTGRVVSPGAIYTALSRLENRGFVRSELGEPTPERGGKRKRHYRIRPGGVAALRSTESALARMARPARVKA
jgi:PadR family transcriptional regulator, regulatory protein PadR